MAIAMAQAGGIGVIHRNLDLEAQATEVRRVKRFESGIVFNPITLTADQTLADAKALQERYNVTGFPVVDEANRAWQQTDDLTLEQPILLDPCNPADAEDRHGFIKKEVKEYIDF